MGGVKRGRIGIGLPITEEHSHAARYPANDNTLNLQLHFGLGNVFNKIEVSYKPVYKKNR